MPDNQVPPQALDAEERVLGAMMMAESAIAAVSDVLTEQDFYRQSHATIYRAALSLYAAGEPVDAVTVADRLAERGELEEIGGKVRVGEIAALTPAVGNAAHYARVVAEQATLRGLLRAGGEITRLAAERGDDAAGLLERAERVVFDLSQARVRHDFVLVRDSLAESYRRLTAAYESGQEVTGLPTGLRDLDSLTSGLHPGNLVVLAGRPSMGKTACALGIAAHVTLRRGLPVALFTLEMNRYEVNQRLVSAEASVDLRNVRNGRLRPDEWNRVQRAFSTVSAAPLYVDDAGAATMLEIRSRARRLKLSKPDLALVVVDYLQLMTSGTGRGGGGLENRVQDVSQISRGLKVLAGELDAPVVALSQLSRGPEARHDKRPLLSDLRESGSIEQDADVVFFAYRDEYYHPEDTTQAGIAEVSVAKHRNGPTGTVKLAFLKRFARFGDLLPEVAAGEPGAA